MDHFPLSDSLIGSPPKCSISFPLAFAYPPPTHPSVPYDVFKRSLLPKQSRLSTYVALGN